MSFSLKKFFRKIGPGFVTGASDDDPSGIATYSQSGANFGFSLLWMAFFMYPFMTAVQETCGRIGVVTGKGLAKVIRLHYSKKVLYFTVLILLIANTINIGADLGAMAATLQLLVPIPFIWLLLGVTFLILLLEILLSYKVYSKFLKYLCLSLLSYVFTVFVVKQDWINIFKSLVIPEIQWSREYILNIVAILGTTISPYLFFWQTSEEVEEEIQKGEMKSMRSAKPKITEGDIKDMRSDTFFGMFYANIIMFFILVTTASTLGVEGIHTIQTAAEAAEALKPIAGHFAYLLFSAGIIGTGLLAVPVLAGSASYAVSETFNWNEGLDTKPNKSKGFYGVIVVATLLGLLINLSPIKPFQMLYYTAILNGICTPPLLLIIILISNNKKIMGKYKNNWLTNLGLIITFIFISLAVLALFL